MVAGVCIGALLEIPSAGTLGSAVGAAFGLGIAAGLIGWLWVSNRRSEQARQAAMDALVVTERRAQLMARLSREFALAGRDVEGLIGALADALQGALGEITYVTLVNDAGVIGGGEYAVRGTSPDLEVELERALAALGGRVERGVTVGVARERKPLLLAEVDPAMLAGRVDPPLRAAVLRLAPHSVLSVPLTARGVVLGVVTLSRGAQATPFTEDDLTLAGEIADRAAVVLNGALLLRDLERQNTELVRAEARFRGLLDMTPDALVVADPDGVIQLVNNEALTLFGYAREALVGQPVEQLVPSAARARHVELRRGQSPVRRAMGRGREVNGRRADGTEFPAEVSLGPILTPQGTCIVAVVRDVTERHRLEAASRRAFALEEQNRRIEDAARATTAFLATMSHELRTPLNAILGFTDLMLQEPERLERVHREYLGHVADSGRHLLKLVNDVLGHARIEAGMLDLEAAPMDLGAVATETLATCEGLALGRQIRLALEAPEPSIPLVSDPRAVRQVLYNLLSNAVKFSPDGGRVTVRLTSPDPDTVAVAVQDEGIGMTPEDVDRLFVPFARLAGARRSSGTGLGLSVSRSLVEALGGTIRVLSAPGQGSTFIVTLPLAPPPSQAPEPP